ncbi:hypothetical protein [Streptomyces sp. G45]|uniref:hypothetical protein n=1 Tax=Streptomyces sp. G45 TaxID=3406627 RepID=UPI003C14256A
MTLAGGDVDALVGAVGAGGFFTLLIVIVWQLAATWRARMLTTREHEYRKLATQYAQLLEDSVELQRRSLDEMAQTREELLAARRQAAPMEAIREAERHV